MKSPETVFVCQACGAQARKWLGRCPDCGEWNSLVEEPAARPGADPGSRAALSGAGAQIFTDIETADADRVSTGVSEFDRVLGGGLVPGSLVLLGGRAGHREVDSAVAGGGAGRGERPDRSLLFG